MKNKQRLITTFNKYKPALLDIYKQFQNETKQGNMKTPAKE